MVLFLLIVLFGFIKIKSVKISNKNTFAGNESYRQIGGTVLLEDKTRQFIKNPEHIRCEM